MAAICFLSQWTVHLDDDLLSGMSRDADYTGGAAITVRHRDTLVEFGVAAFTPAEIATAQTISDDRPYAGLIYLSGAIVRQQDALSSSVTGLTLGYLGSDLVARAQRGVHRTIGSIQPEGWRHQISDGGEATARLMHERQWAREPVSFAGSDLQLLYRAGAGIGFMTDVTAGVAARWGRFASPRWRIHASPTGLGYREVVTGADARDRFVYGALSARVPFYNVLLQGQFRDSDVTVPADARRRVVPDVTLGFVVGLPQRRHLCYFMRAQLSDVRLSQRTDTIVYAGLALSW